MNTKFEYKYSFLLWSLTFFSFVAFLFIPFGVVVVVFVAYVRVACSVTERAKFNGLSAF